MKHELWDPFEDMNTLRKEINKLFDKSSNDTKPPKGHNIREPLADVIDKKDKIIAKIELPGVDKKDVTVHVEENCVEIKAEKKQEKEEKKKDYHKQERRYTGFYKAFTLPARISPDKAKAEFKNGMLTLTMLKVIHAPSRRKQLKL